MRGPDLRPLCQWLGMDPEAFTVEGGLASWGGWRTRLQATVAGRQGWKVNTWSQLGRLMVRGDGLGKHLRTILAADWRYRVLLGLPSWVAHVLLPTVSFPGEAASRLGPLIFDGKTRIKVFRDDGTILNVARREARDLLQADVGARRRDGQAPTITPGIVEAGRLNGVDYFIEPYVHGDPVTADTGKESTRVVGALKLWYERTGISDLGSADEYVQRCGAAITEQVKSRSPGDSAAAWAADMERLAVRVGELASGMAPARLDGARIHGDVNPTNIVDTGERLVLLDWECSRRASLTHDVLNYYSWSAVFRRDLAPIEAALAGEGTVAEVLGLGRAGEATGLVVPYALAYASEKLVLQLETSRGDDDLLDRRLARWLSYWDWLLDVVEQRI